MRLHNYTSSTVCVSFAKIKSIFFLFNELILLCIVKKMLNNARIDRCISNIFLCSLANKSFQVIEKQ